MQLHEIPVPQTVRWKNRQGETNEPLICFSLSLFRYCDCFANGEFCNNCNCNNCFNNLNHEEERQKAIKQCLDRNANAFKPKVSTVTSTIF